jgi:hypothetical protein
MSYSNFDSAGPLGPRFFAGRLVAQFRQRHAPEKVVGGRWSVCTWPSHNPAANVGC